MSKEQLQQEIKKELEEIGKRHEVFVIIIDAINQVIEMLFADWNPWMFVQSKTMPEVLKRLPKAAGREQPFQTRGHNFSLHGPTLISR